VSATAKNVGSLIGGTTLIGLAASGQQSFAFITGELVPMKVCFTQILHSMFQAHIIEIAPIRCKCRYVYFLYSIRWIRPCCIQGIDSTHSRRMALVSSIIQEKRLMNNGLTLYFKVVLHHDYCQLPFWSALLSVLLPSNLQDEVPRSHCQTAAQGLRLRGNRTICRGLLSLSPWTFVGYGDFD
jgi:hypothetical protein